MTNKFTEHVETGWLPDGKRFALRHGPIDLVIEATGNVDQVALAYQQAATAFETVLTNLVVELDILRKPLGPAQPILQGEIAQNMYRATSKIAGSLFASPMISVAGAVADYILAAMKAGTSLERAYVNNGGDIALYLSNEAHFDIGICADIETGEIMSKAHIASDHKVGGIATSGWQGRSHSLGIADAVTVLAKNAASADVAATLIANAIDLPNHAEITRVPASELSPDSDLGHRPVTVAVGMLQDHEIELALSRGRALASSMIGHGHIEAVFANLRGQTFNQGACQNVLRGETSHPSNMASKELVYA
ncbi:MAG: UPF0280 family protein [Hyphomicrobiales bacterium]